MHLPLKPSDKGVISDAAFFKKTLQLDKAQRLTRLVNFQPLNDRLHKQHSMRNLIMYRSDSSLTPAKTIETRHDCATEAPFYRLTPEVGYTHQPRYQVIPVSHGFFHIREANSGQVKGFRCNHYDACELAIYLEKKPPNETLAAHR